MQGSTARSGCTLMRPGAKRLPDVSRCLQTLLDASRMSRRCLPDASTPDAKMRLDAQIPPDASRFLQMPPGASSGFSEASPSWSQASDLSKVILAKWSRSCARCLANASPSWYQPSDLSQVLSVMRQRLLRCLPRCDPGQVSELFASM
jgi:hypothetical protein